MQTPPANPVAALGLPPTWQISPLAITFTKIQAQTPVGVVDHHVMLVDTPLGRFGFALNDDGLRGLIDVMTQVVSGLAVVRAMPAAPPAGNGQAR